MVSQISSDFPAGQTRVDLINDEGKTVEFLDLNEIDPIFASSFQVMIQEAFQEGKHFILAKMQTKQDLSDGEQLIFNTQNHNFFFNAYGILKIIFQKKDHTFVGRYHDKHPITAKNPITNQVEFYIIKNRKIDLVQQAELKAAFALKKLAQEKNDLIQQPPVNDEDLSSIVMPISYTAEFFGTDFNFLYSEEMQKTVLENCTADNLDQMLTFKTYSGQNIQIDIAGFLNNGGQGLNFDSQMNEIVQKAFANTRKFIRMGAISILFYFISIYTIINAILPIAVGIFPGEDNLTITSITDASGYGISDELRLGYFLNNTDTQKPQNSTQSLNIDTVNKGYQIQQTAISEKQLTPEDFMLPFHIFYIAVPIAAVLYHYELIRVNGKKEIKFFFYAKFVMYAGYYTMIILTYALKQETILRACYYTMIIVCCIGISYSYAIFTWKWMQDSKYVPAEAPDGQEQRSDAVRALDSAIPTEFFFRSRLQNQNIQATFDNRNFAGGLAEAGQNLVEVDIPSYRNERALNSPSPLFANQIELVDQRNQSIHSERPAGEIQQPVNQQNGNDFI